MIHGRYWQWQSILNRDVYKRQFLISVAVEGFLFRKVNAVLRILCFAGAYLLIDSGLITDIIGIAICVGIVLLQKTMAKKHGTIVT